jgi:glycogenin glucosyltransferase
MGALVLAESLTQVNTTRSKVILITPDVTTAMRDLLKSSFTEVVSVDVLDSQNVEVLAAMKRPELGVTLTKIHCWSLTQYSKCVFLDADILVVKNADELFERPQISAVPDIGWPDCFNTGVFVFTPSTETLKGLLKLAAEEGSFDGGDQGLLNAYFSDWFSADSAKHLSFIYNMTLIAAYSYPPAYKR